jgi:hypothetical protein
MSLDEYTAAVVTKLAERLGCTQTQAENLAGDCDDFHSDMLTVDEAVEQLVIAEAGR